MWAWEETSSIKAGPRGQRLLHACHFPSLRIQWEHSSRQWMHASPGAAMTAFFCRPDQTHVNLELKMQRCCRGRSSGLINQVRRCGIRLKASFLQTPAGARAEHAVSVMREKNENFQQHDGNPPGLLLIGKQIKQGLLESIWATGQTLTCVQPTH